MSETPILDLEQEPPEARRSWLPRVIGVALGIVIAIFLIAADEGMLPQLRWPSFNGLLFLPALYVAIAIHELGHLVAGKLAGIEPGGISVGPFVFVKSGTNWVFQFERRRWIGGFYKPLASWATLQPSRFVWMVAGGPFAGFMTAGVCLLARIYTGDGSWSWISSLFWVSMFIVVGSVIPYASGLNTSDGARILILLREPARARSWLALLALQTDEANGMRPREWDPLLVQQALMDADSHTSEYPYRQLMLFYWAVDREEECLALNHLEKALAKSGRSGKAFRHALFIEAASASADLRKRADHARVWAGRACKLLKPKSLDVVEAGIARCEGHYQEAAQLYEAAQARVVRQKLDSGLFRLAKEKWAVSEAECHQLAATQAALTMSRNE